MTSYSQWVFVKMVRRGDANESQATAILDRSNTRPSMAVPPELIGRIAPVRTPEFAVKTTFYTEQKNLLNQYITKLNPEILRGETGLSTGTFGT
jgi:hypothetical protein